MPGLDRARVILNDIPNEFRPSTAAGPVEYSPELVIAMDQWTTETGPGGEKGITLPGSEGAGDELPPLYQIISGYSYISYIPATSVPVPTLGELRKATLEGDLVHLGVISTDQEIIDPPIGAGTWMIAFRGAGASPDKKPETEGEEEKGDAPETVATTQREQAEEALGFDTTVDTLILFDTQGQPVTAFPALAPALHPDLEERPFHWGNTRKPSVGPVDRVFKVIEEEEEVEYTERWLEFELFIPGKSRKGARTVLGLRFNDGVVDQAWRKS